jgi:L-threonylcarbamoyladenylate synthase
MRARILPTHGPELLAAAVEQAAELLQAGELVALPTETVYGLAANALNANAVAKVFAVKGRPPNNPLIVHVASVEMARRCVAEWPAVAQKLAHAFWPGPLTLVLPKAACVPSIVTAGGATVGVRWPSHPVIQAVIRACGFPLAAPSANRFAELSPTTAAHVQKSLGDRIPLIVDGGQTPVGIESTVMDLTERPPRLLRPGMIHAEALLAVTGELSSGGAGTPGEAPLRSPGQLPQHFALRVKLVVWSWADEAELRARIADCGLRVADCRLLAYAGVPSVEGLGGVSLMPREAPAYARALYAELHRCQEPDARLIIVEAPPSGPEWRAVADRLARAAG